MGNKICSRPTDSIIEQPKLRPKPYVQKDPYRTEVSDLAFILIFFLVIDSASSHSKTTKSNDLPRHDNFIRRHEHYILVPVANPNFKMSGPQHLYVQARCSTLPIQNIHVQHCRFHFAFT